MFINGDTFLGLLQAYRILWIKGRFGGGKSALSYRIAYDLVKSGFCKNVISNIKDVISDNPDDIKFDENDCLNSVIILDEGGVFLKLAKDVEEYLTLMRKINCVIIIPSVMPPAQRVRFFSCQRVMNLQRLGFPAWVYRWDLNYGGEHEREFFVWYHPEEIYGVYDTKAPPIDDGGISEFLDKRKEEFRGKLGYSNKRRPEARFEGATVQGASLDQGSGFAELALEAAEIQSEAISAYVERANKRRR